MVIFYTIKAYSEGKVIDINTLDNFVIGHFVDEQPVLQIKSIKQKQSYKPKSAAIKNTTVVTKTKTPSTTTTTTTTPRPLTNEETRLYSDCIEALVSLGMKKTYSRQITKEVFQKYKINTIQEFITTAMKMVHNQ